MFVCFAPCPPELPQPEIVAGVVSNGGIDIHNALAHGAEDSCEFEVTIPKTHEEIDHISEEAEGYQQDTDRQRPLKYAHLVQLHEAYTDSIAKLREYTRPHVFGSQKKDTIKTNYMQYSEMTQALKAVANKVNIEPPRIASPKKYQANPTCYLLSLLDWKDQAIIQIQQAAQNARDKMNRLDTIYEERRAQYLASIKALQDAIKASETFCPQDVIKDCEKLCAQLQGLVGVQQAQIEGAQSEMV